MCSTGGGRPGSVEETTCRTTEPAGSRTSAARDIAPGEPSFAAYAAALGGASTLLRTAEQDRQLAAELFALDTRVRAEAAAREPRYRRLSLAQMMLLRAEDELLRPQGDPRQAAEIAAAIAGALLLDFNGRARPLAALAWWLLGKGLLRSFHRRLAREAFANVEVLVRQGEISEEAALLSAGLAQVQEDLGRVDGAATLWLRASHVYAKLGAAQRVASCQAQFGLLLLETGDVANAARPLSKALALLDARFAPSLTARVSLGFAEVQATLGDIAAAEELVVVAKALYELSATPAEPTARTWREARVVAALQRDEQADHLFGEARHVLLRDGSFHEASRITLDHLLLRLASCRAGTEITELTDALAASFPGRGETWASRMRAAAIHAANRPRASYRLCHELRRRLRSCRPDRRRPALLTTTRTPDRGRPPFLTSTRTLGDRLLRSRSEVDDPIGSAPNEI